ncbi:sugar ABC transporter permease [Oceanobacillus alkalisoli]|uniref:sugar ABC transporter permease n=1 Tax=Oceanobacillus alkalisoli TaxID=2925113 RepID=UPI001F11F1FF|nr:sugar ABC transporter permease [Oceanobacillus alkalisoli]MCF3942801.1 sugar ABC transporter permease [Oceanobacillus alkalisoli]
MTTNNENKKTKESKISFKFNAQSYALIIALVLIAVLFAVLTGGEFLSSRNLSNLFTQMTVISVLAIGMTFVIVTAHIDLSVGSLAGLTGGIAGILHVWYDWNTGIVVLAAVMVGALLGLFQGWWVAYRAVPAFIVTLGGMLIFRGILVGITGGQTIAPMDQSFRSIAGSYLPFSLGYILAVSGIILLFFFTIRRRARRRELQLQLPSPFMDFGKISLYAVGILLVTYILSRYQGIPLPLIIVVVLGGIFIFVSSKTAFGRSIYAIGGNKEAAALSGINIKRNTFLVFGLMGALAGIAGIILTSRLNAATTGAGDMYELDAIAACVIGGTSLAGGRGYIVGSIIGALIMVSIDNGMSMMNIPTFWQYIVKGSILIVAVWVDIASKNKTSASVA